MAHPYDITAGVGAENEDFADRILTCLQDKGFCTINPQVKDQALQEALAEVRQLSENGAFSPPPLEVVEGLLGADGSARVAALPPAESGSVPALGRLDHFLSSLGGILAVGSAESTGMWLRDRTPGLIHVSSLRNSTPRPVLAEDAAAQWLDIFAWHKLMLLIFLGPGRGVLELESFKESSGEDKHEVKTEPGMVVVLRADLFGHNHRPQRGDAHVLSCWLQEAARGQRRGMPSTMTPVAQRLNQRGYDRLLEIVESGDKDSVLSLENSKMWLSAIDHTYRQGQQTAVRGAAMKFTGSHDATINWNMLLAGADCATEPPLTRWNHEQYYDPSPDAHMHGKISCRHGAFFDGIELFDAKFFRIVPGEAKSMDPMQRLILEVGYDALVHAGRSKRDLTNSLTAVYIGVQWTEFGLISQGDQEAGGCEQRAAGTGVAPSLFTGRFSFVLGLAGPSVTLDTEGSSSLSAIDTGINSLGPARVAATACVCGGASSMLGPQTWIVPCAAGRMSPAGRCFTFDQSASGWVRGEGLGIVVLENLVDVVEGERVVDDSRPLLGSIGSCVLRHSATGSGLGAPSGPAQQSSIAEALRAAQISPSSVDFVECHGDGLPMHDALELLSVHRALCAARYFPLAVTSVKTQQGHSIQSAGMAGLFRVLATFSRAALAPMVHLRMLNANLASSDHAALLIDEAMPLAGEVSLAGIAAFGFGGTLGHAVLSGVSEVAELQSQGPASVIVRN